MNDVRAAFDIGSNTVKLTVSRIVADRLELLLERAVITRLSGGLEGAMLDDQAIDRTIEALRAMLEEARALGAERTAAVATAGLRRAGDPEKFIERARRELGLEVRLIDGVTEAELAFSGSTSGRFGPGGLVLDIGGRSTEIAFGRTSVEEAISLDLGCITLATTHRLTDAAAWSAVETATDDAVGRLRAAPEVPHDLELIGGSGTVLALAGRTRGIQDMARLLEVAEDAPLLRSDVECLLPTMAAQSRDERRFGTVIPEGRADVIVAGACILVGAFRRFGRDAIHVTRRGLRHGVLLHA